jgi:histidyl-tRNA synthetase
MYLPQINQGAFSGAPSPWHTGALRGFSKPSKNDYDGNMGNLIEARVLKGFRDFLPAQEIARRTLVEAVEGEFRKFGFVPIDTPALEYTEILLGKGGGETEKQIYRFNDSGGRDVALRFDLTVPFARFIAAHRADLIMPFKRYHIAKVWRGENTQRGRYREFTQCDFDCIGSDTAASDFEILLMMKEALSAAGVSSITIRLNHRGLFNRFLQKINAFEHSEEILRTVDKLAKIGRDEVVKLLATLLDADRARQILEYVEIKGSWDAMLAAMTEKCGGANPDSDRLALIRRYMIDTGAQDCFVIDPSITRGLDYYTGIVYETFLNDLPDIGSVCSGGRYDNLMGLYSNEKLSGVGSSIGLDRLIAALETLGKINEQKSYATLALACVDEAKFGLCQALANKMRNAGIACEVCTEAAGKDNAKKLTAQFIAAEKKGARFVIIPSDDDPLNKPFVLRDLKARRNIENVLLENLADLMSALPAQGEMSA